MMHPDLLAAVAAERGRSLRYEAEAFRLAHPDHASRPRRLRLPARPWLGWQLRNPIVRRPPARLECS